MIQKNLDIVDADARIEVATTGGYTFYDESTETSYVQIKRGTDDEEIAKIEIIYNINGTSETYIIEDSTYFPEPNGMQTIILPISEKPDSVRVVAYYLKAGKIKAGIPSSDAEIIGNTAAEPAEDGDYTPATDSEGKEIVDDEGNLPPIITFLQATDTHIHVGGNPLLSALDGRTDNCISPNYLSAFPSFYDLYCEEDGGSKLPTIAWINTTDAMNKIPNVDFSVITGDLVAQAAFNENKTDSIAKFVEIADTLNHDYYTISHTRFHDKVSNPDNYNYYVENIGPQDWNFTMGKNLFIGTSLINLTQINETLNLYKGQDMTLFVFTHWEGIAPLLESHLENFNEIIVIRGHWHNNMYDHEEGGVHYITTTAAMNYPTEFRIFEIYNNRIEIRMSEITSPEVNAVSETMVNYYIENGMLRRDEPVGSGKTGLTGEEWERTITIPLD